VGDSALSAEIVRTAFVDHPVYFLLLDFKFLLHLRRLACRGFQNRSEIPRSRVRLG
jgi:hypothetical protein